MQQTMISSVRRDELRRRYTCNQNVVSSQPMIHSIRKASILLSSIYFISGDCTAAFSLAKTYSTRPATASRRSPLSSVPNNKIGTQPKNRCYCEDLVNKSFQNDIPYKRFKSGLSKLYSEADDSESTDAFASTSKSSSISVNTKNNEEKFAGASAPGVGLAPPFSVTIETTEAGYSYMDAIQRTVAWVSAAFIFGSCLWIVAGPQAGEEFFAGYIVEQSLSVDNLFVFLLLFEYFQVPLQYQDRVLNWGIYGAVVMRAIMIGAGVVALSNFREILLVFASILIYGSVKFFISTGADESEEEDLSENKIIKFSKKLFQSVDEFDGNRFFIVKEGVRMATPLFICLLSVEISDVVFAVDSVPAVFGVTENPLIIFTSNIFAIMGLRSMYTILSKAASDLKYLEPAVAIVLGFIGSKMFAEYFGFHVPTNISLAVVAALLGSGIGASILEKRLKSNSVLVESEVSADTK